MTLAVLTPEIGLASETFVRRHLTGLAPGRTLTVATDRPEPSVVAWSAPGPVVRLAGVPERPAVARRAARVASRLRGRPPGAWRWAPTEGALAALDAALDRAGTDVVLAEYLDIWLPLVPWLKARGLRVVGHGHGYDVSVRLRDAWWRERYRGYEAVDAVVVPSAHVRARLAAIGLDPSRIHVVPCGVDVGVLPPPRPKGATVEVIAVGRFVAKKAPLATIEAFRLAHEQSPNLRLTMIGDGPLLDAARASALDADLIAHVRFLGAQRHESVLEHLRRADLYVQHSVVGPNGDEEGIPVAMLEAMAAGVPVVSTRHAGIPEVVDDGVTGVLVGEGDVDAMAEAIAALARDPDRRRAMGEAGYERVAERLSWERERRDLCALLGLR